MSSLWDVAELSVEVVGVSGVKSLDPLALTFPPLVHTSLPEPENKRGTLLIKHKSPHLILKPGLAAYVPAKTMCVCVCLCAGEEADRPTSRWEQCFVVPSNVYFHSP